MSVIYLNTNSALGEPKKKERPKPQTVSFGATDNSELEAMIATDKQLMIGLVRWIYYMAYWYKIIVRYNAGEKALIPNDQIRDLMIVKLKLSYMKFLTVRTNYKNRQKELRDVVTANDSSASAGAKAAKKLHDYLSENVEGDVSQLGNPLLLIPVAVWVVTGIIGSIATIGYFVTKNKAKQSLDVNAAQEQILELAKTNPELAAQFQQSLLDFQQEKEKSDSEDSFWTKLGTGVQTLLVLTGISAAGFTGYKIYESYNSKKKAA